MATPEPTPSLDGHTVRIPKQALEPFQGRHERRPIPSDILNMLSKAYSQVVFDGFTADVTDENPYGNGVNKSYVERMSHVLWKRGQAFRDSGRSLKAALLVEE